MSTEKNGFDTTVVKLKRSTAELLVLSLLARKDMYGYQLTHELIDKSEGLFSYREASFYPILSSLHGKGYISSYKEVTDESRIRVYYHIEKAGMEYYRGVKSGAQKYFGYVQMILDEDGVQTSDENNLHASGFYTV